MSCGSWPPRAPTATAATTTVVRAARVEVDLQTPVAAVPVVGTRIRVVRTGLRRRRPTAADIALRAHRGTAGVDAVGNGGRRGGNGDGDRDGQTGQSEQCRIPRDPHGHSSVAPRSTENRSRGTPNMRERQ